MQIKLRFEPVNKGLPPPFYASKGASGFDIAADIAPDCTVIIRPGQHALIPTGLYLAVPEGYELQVRSRSGIAAKQRGFVLNSPGTVDSDYRGEVKVILANLGDDDLVIKGGDRIAQGVVCPVVQVVFDLVETLPETLRGEGGFGSTGV